jgi:hypothetical protein
VPAKQAHLNPHYIKKMPFPHAIIKGRAVQVQMNSPIHAEAINGTHDVIA